ncbi:MAG: hypothetical protein ACP5NC_08120 [Nitrososphaeria archaeon]
MNKSEIIVREIGCSYLDGTKRFTQLELSRSLGLSLSTVNGVVKKLDGIGAVRIKLRGFAVIDFKKLVYFYATHRNLGKDVVYATRVDANVGEIESAAPGGIAFTAYTAYVMLYGEAPSDYSEVYFYAGPEALAEVKNRFKEANGPPNVIVLKPDEKLLKDIKERRLKKSSVCPVQLFADLWNINSWYAKEYAEALERRLI